MNGTRGSGITEIPTDLLFYLRKNGDLHNAYDMQKVEIYDSYEKAEGGASTDIIETISSGNITNLDTGKYKYTAAAISSVGTFFDKVILIPDPGLQVRNFINPFYIRLQNYVGEVPESHEKCRVFLNLFDIVDNPQEGDRVVVRMNVKRAWYGKDFIESEEEVFRANSSGQVLGQDGESGMLLIETETLTEDTFPNGGDTVYYTFNILDKYYFKKTIARGTLQSNFKDLPEYTE